MDISEIKSALEAESGCPVPDSFMDYCILAFSRAHHGTATSENGPDLGFYSPFKSNRSNPVEKQHSKTEKVLFWLFLVQATVWALFLVVELTDVVMRPGFKPYTLFLRNPISFCSYLGLSGVALVVGLIGFVNYLRNKDSWVVWSIFLAAFLALSHAVFLIAGIFGFEDNFASNTIYGMFMTGVDLIFLSLLMKLKAET